jgi:hypothetical protein
MSEPNPTMDKHGVGRCRGIDCSCCNIHVPVGTPNPICTIDGRQTHVAQICKPWAERIVAENQQLRQRLRTTAQSLIACIGAIGPENAEESATRAVAEIVQLRQQLAEAQSLNARLSDGIEIARQGRDQALDEAKAEVQKDMAKLRSELAKSSQCRTALLLAIGVAKIAYEHWDADRQSKVGKCLAALSGHLPGYMPDTDVIHSIIREVNAQQSAKSSP